MGTVNTGLQQLPDNSLEPRIYQSFVAVHLAIANLVQQVSELTGIDEYPPDLWPQLTPATTLTTGNATRMYLPAGVNLTAGQMVNLYNNAGVLSVRLAQGNAAGTMAHGIVNASCLAGETASINYLRTYTDLIGGLAIGVLYYLDPAVAGGITNVRPAAAGNIIQPVGVGLSATTLALDIPLSYIQL